MKKAFLLLFLLISASSFAQDTLQTKTIFLKKNYNFSIDTVNDTSFFHIHQYEIGFKYFGLDIGNGFSSFYNFQTSLFIPNKPFWLMPFQAYYSEIDDRYMHTRYPFTRLRLIANTNRTHNEEIVNVLHSQNINKQWNFMIDGVSNKRISKLPHQDNRYHYLYASTNYLGNRYQCWANYYFSRLKTKENGGVQSPSFLTDSLYPYENALVYLTKASNKYTIQQANFEQLFTFSKKDSISSNHKLWILQRLNWNKAKKTYNDFAIDTVYYHNIFLDSTKTYDSLFFQYTQFAVGLSYKNNSAKTSGINVLFNYHNQESYSYQLPIVRDGTSAEFYLWKKWKSHYLAFLSSVGLSGYLIQNFSFQLYSFRTFSVGQDKFQWKTLLSVEQKEPDIFLQHFSSNHFRWSHQFPFSQFYLIETSIQNSSAKMKLFYKYGQQLIIFDTNATPKLLTNASFMGSEISKLFKISHLYSYHRIQALWASTSHIRIPPLSAYHSLYLQSKLFKKVLTLQLGFDVWYHSPFKTLAYSPVLNTFYLSDKKTDWYPVIGAFLNAQLKRAQFFIKIDHINHQWQKSNFFLLESYPLSPRMVKFGIFWNFYD
ncbi:MAG: putative porin [Bacteroidales bacterium]|nr:putative porin [Bacteroidales bacterium]